MNSKTAKRIRKQIYGDYSPLARSYIRDPKTNAIINTGLRREYLDAKKAYKVKRLN